MTINAKVMCGEVSTSLKKSGNFGSMFYIPNSTNKNFLLDMDQTLWILAGVGLMIVAKPEPMSDWHWFCYSALELPVLLRTLVDLSSTSGSFYSRPYQHLTKVFDYSPPGLSGVQRAIERVSWKNGWVNVIFFLIYTCGQSHNLNTLIPKFYYWTYKYFRATYSLQRDPRYFSPLPDPFLTERWLSQDQRLALLR